MIDKRIEVCIGTQRDGGVRVRLSLLVVLDRKPLAEHFHSFTLLPGDDPASARKLVEGHLALDEDKNQIPQSPWGPIPDSEWNKVLAVLSAFHTAERVAERRKSARNPT